MTTTPNFDDLTLPDELVTEALRDEWFERYYLLTKQPLGLLPVAAEHGYRAGARHGWEQARQLWPEPSTDRPPTEADGDEQGWVMRLTDGVWRPWKWDETHGDGWLHTPRWQPRQPSLKEQALARLDTLGTQPASQFWQLDPDSEAVIRRALEQAGEGKT